MKKILPLTLLISLTNVLFCVAQLPGTWTFNKGCNGNSGPCTTTGITTVGTSEYHLTSYGSNITTTMWNNTIVSLDKPFTLSFDVYFGAHNGTNEGGEGLTFAMQGVDAPASGVTQTNAVVPTQLTAGGYGGGDLGIKCNSSGGGGAFTPNAAGTHSIDVEFDVFDNTNGCTGGCSHAGDIPQDHIGINEDDCSSNSSASTLGAPTPALAGGVTIRDGVWRPAVVTWTPNAPVVLSSMYDNYYSSCPTTGTFVDKCGNTVAWSSITCNASRNCNVMGVATGTLTVSYNGVVKESSTINVESILNGSQGINGTNINHDVIFGFTSSTEGKTNDQWIRNPVFLPIRIAYFNLVKLYSSSIEVKWATASEQNSSFFSIERSADSQNWETIGTRKAQGNSLNLVTYTYTDNNVTGSFYYYRIKETDMDGKTSYTKIESIDLNSNAVSVDIYPNPIATGEDLKIIVSEQVSEINIEDINGRLIKTYNAANHTEIIIPTTNINPGIYFIKVFSNDIITVKKQIIY